MLGAREGVVGTAGNLNEMSGDVVRHVGMDERRPVRDRFLEVDRHRQRLVLDGNKRGRVLRRIAVDRDHHRDRLADVVHVVARQRPLRVRILHRLMRDQQRHRDVEVADIVAGVDRDDTRMLAGRADVDRLDARACVAAAHERRVQRA